MRGLLAVIVVVVGLFSAWQSGQFDFSNPSANKSSSSQSSSSSSASTADPEDCRTVKEVVTVTLDPAKYPLTLDHTLDAIAAGEAKILHIDRAGSDANRDASLAGIPTKDGYDRDEYPPAMSKEGGEGADVRYVPFADNRGAGSSMGAQLSPYCSGQAFQVVSG